MESFELEQHDLVRVGPRSSREDPNNDSPGTGSDVESPSQHHYATGFRLVLMTIGLILGIFLSALDQNIIATAIPSITTEFGSIANIAWYGSAYGVTQTAFQSAWGKAYKHFPLKLVFVLAVAVFEAGNVICAVAGSSDVLIFGRIIAGLGGGGVGTGCFIMIAFTAKEEYRAAYMGIIGVTYGAAGVLGPLLGGALADGPGWRWCFWISLPVGGLALTIICFAFRPPLQPKEGTILHRLVEIDFGGGILIAGFLACFVLAMHWGGTRTWSHPRVVGSLVGFVLLLIATVANEWWMGDKAMIQPHLIKDKRIAANLGFIFFLAGAFFPLLYTLPVQFQSVDGTSASQSGIRLIPLVLGVSVFTMVSNGVLTYWRHYKPFLLIGALLATIGISCIHSLGANTSTGTWIGFESLTAVGVGLALQIPMISNQAAVGTDDIASVTALTLFVENAGTCLFVASGEAAFTKSLMQHLAQKMPSLDPTAVLNAGATQVRDLFKGKELEEVLGSYLEGSQVSHVVSVACGAAACLISLTDAGPTIVKMVRERVFKSHSM